MTDAATAAPGPAPAPAARRVISQRREFAIIIVLSLLAVSMIALASATNSYVPLFFAWVPYLGIPLLVSRLDKARASGAMTMTTERSDDETADGGGGEADGDEGADTAEAETPSEDEPD